MAFEDKNDAETRDRLRSLIRLRGRLPAGYRFTAWKYLLQLPGNSSSFQELVRKGPHPAAVASLAIRYPLRNRQLFRKLAVLISVVAHWSPVLGEAEFVPAWLFPFVVVFQQDDLGASEAAMTFLLNWGSRLLVTFPQPPVPVLSAMEMALRRADPVLAAHLRGLSVGALSFGWPLLRSAFSEVLSREDWLRLLDHVFASTARPDMLEVAAVAFAVALRPRLLSCRSAEAAEALFRRRQPIDLDEMLGLMERVAMLTAPGTRQGEAGDMSDPEGGRRAAAMAFLKAAPTGFVALARGRYPAFDGYPRVEVNYQAELRERVACQEEELEQRRQLVKELESRAEAIMGFERGLGAPVGEQNAVFRESASDRGRSLAADREDGSAPAGIIEAQAASCPSRREG